MPDPDRLLTTYLHLARAAGLRKRPLIRSKMLVLAAAAAARSGLLRVAAACREQILAECPHHLLSGARSMAAAMRHDEFQSLLRRLESRYPSERAEQLLDSLAIDPARDRQLSPDGDDDEAYAASLLGTTAAELHRRFP